MTPADEALDRVAIGARIRQLREARSLTPREVAEKVGCSRPHIANVEAGRSRASQQLRDALADLFGERVA